jgi:hypothetical protein
MKSLNELIGQRPECKRDPPLSADSCSCAAPFPTAAHQNAAFMKELTKKTRLESSVPDNEQSPWTTKAQANRR